LLVVAETNLALKLLPTSSIAVCHPARLATRSAALRTALLDTLTDVVVGKRSLLLQPKQTTESFLACLNLQQLAACNFVNAQFINDVCVQIAEQ